MADDPKKAPVSADDGLDVIPVNKTPVGLIVGVVLGVLVVGGTIAWSMGGGRGKAAHEGAPPAVASEGLSKEELKQRREHIEMTQRALAKAEEAAKAKQAEEDAKKAKKEEEEATQPAKGSGGPAPVSGAAAKKTSGDLDNVLDSTLSGLE
jgi:hypothetical protein